MTQIHDPCTQEAEAGGSLQRLACSVVSSRLARVNYNKTLSSRGQKRIEDWDDGTAGKVLSVHT